MRNPEFMLGGCRVIIDHRLGAREVRYLLRRMKRGQPRRQRVIRTTPDCYKIGDSTLVMSPAAYRAIHRRATHAPD